MSMLAAAAAETMGLASSAAFSAPVDTSAIGPPATKTPPPKMIAMTAVDAAASSALEKIPDAQRPIAAIASAAQTTTDCASTIDSHLREPDATIAATPHTAENATTVATKLTTPRRAARRCL